MRSSRSGWSIGSPPLNATTDVPSAASLSIRFFSVSVGIGGETLSYSLQYPQSMLQRRIGMIWTRSGCDVSNRTRRNSRADRALRTAVVMSFGDDIDPQIIAQRCEAAG